MRKVLVNSLIVVISVVLTYAVLEIGYRVITYIQLSHGYEPFTVWWTDQPLHLADDEAGYRYPTDANVRYTQTEPPDVSVYATNVLTNNDGMVGTIDVPLEKGEREYRIALIGDSFTAGVFNDHPWSGVLQSLLDDDADLRATLNVDRITVLNFGLEAIGMEQFDDVYAYRAAEYDPDMVIVSFISDDLRRRFLWEGVTQIEQDGRTWDLHLTCYRQPVSIDNPWCVFGVLILPQHFVADGSGLEQMRQDLYNVDIARRPWLAPYPELLAATIGWRFGLVPRLSRTTDQLRLYPSDTAAIHISRTELDKLLAMQPNNLLVHIPTHVELLNGVYDRPMPDFLATYPDLPIIETVPLLMADAAEEDIRSWYNLPFDGHFSDLGAERYAAVVHNLLRDQLLP